MGGFCEYYGITDIGPSHIQFHNTFALGCFFEHARFEENVHNGKTIPDLFKMPYNIVCIEEENRLLVLDLMKYYAPITISYFGVRLITL